MKIAAAQLNYTIGDIRGNTEKIIHALKQGAEMGADLVVFSELSVCGYIPKDLLEYESFIDACEEAVAEIARHTLKVAALIGTPVRSRLKKGKALYNSALFLYQGKIQHQMNKTLLPTYDIFDEYRYFEPNTSFEVVSFKGHKIAVSICEDLWNLNPPHLYNRNPMDELMLHQPNLMINLSGSPYSYNHVEDRVVRMQENARHYRIPLLYVNQVGAQTEILFDGGSLWIDANGNVQRALPAFAEAFELIDTDHSTPKGEIYLPGKDYDIEHIHHALVMGIRDYFQKMGFKKAVLGSSGGIDSAVVHALAAEAIGAENVHAVLMPSRYSSEGSVNDARELATRLGSPYQIIPIKDLTAQFELALQEAFAGKNPDVTEENIQARTRGVLLMALSNKFGYFLLNTSNKSEAAVGYTTLYGDMCGGLSPIGDLYKTQVYAMAKFINRTKEIIPLEIIHKEPSAELRPGQKDSDSLPVYEILDQILFHYIENERSSKEISDLGFEKDMVQKVLMMVNRNEFKRFQAPPILRISHKAFGFGRQMPLVAKYFES